MTDIPILFVWDWFRTGLPDSGWSAIALSTIGVGAALLGAMVTWGINLWRTRLTQRQIDVTSQNSRYDRFQRGIEMLGSPELFVRLGGIYALRALMKEDPQELHIPAVELLCAFLRNPIDADAVTNGSSVRQDIQTALEVLVGRGGAEVALEKARGFSLDLRNANLEHAELSEVYGSDRKLRLWLEREEIPHVMAIKSNEKLWAWTDKGPLQERADRLASGVEESAWVRCSAGNLRLGCRGNTAPAGAGQGPLAAGPSQPCQAWGVGLLRVLRPGGDSLGGAGIDLSEGNLGGTKLLHSNINNANLSNDDAK